MAAHVKCGAFMIFIFIILLFAIDQITKYLTVAKLTESESIAVIDGILNFSRVHNTGGPWSMFDNFSIVFIALTFAIFAAEIYYFRKYPLNHVVSKIAAALINGGALGNLADRIFRGYVVDMIDLRFIDYPVFNFADCCIVVGCILMCIYVIFIYKDPKKYDVKKEFNDGKNNSDLQ